MMTSQIDIAGRSFVIKKNPHVCLKNLPQNLLFAVEESSGVLFLVNSGCEISILPKILTNGINHYFQPHSRAIQGLGNETIHPVGSIDVHLNIGNIQPIKHNFWVTEEPRNYGIIGLDFLKANNFTQLSYIQ